MTTLPSIIDKDVRRGEGREKSKSDARARSTNPRFPWSPPPPCWPTGSPAPQRHRGQPRRTPPRSPRPQLLAS